MTKSILITGAAQGIGAEIARTFYHQGYLVGIFDINEIQSQKLAKELGSRAFAGYLDVSDHENWQRALQQFVQWAEELNILVNNAGILYSGAFEHTNIQAHQRTIDINIKGVINGCHAALPYLKQAHFSRIINLSSASAIYGQADLASYSASKFAVRGLTEALDIEWQKYGIQVVDVMPLFVQTAMVKNMDAGSIQNMGIHLSAADVAAQVLKLAQQKDHFFRATHTLIGLKAKILYQLSNISPQFLNRFSNFIISRRKN